GDYAYGAPGPVADARRIALLVLGRWEAGLLSHLFAVPRRPPRRPGSLRARLQPVAGQFPGQRDDRAAHRELRVLARGQRWARAAARGDAVELGDAEMGGLPHGAGDLVGDPLLVRSDGVEAENVGEDGKRDAGCGRRAMSCRSWIAGVALLAASPIPLPASRIPQDTTHGKAVYVKWCAGCHGDGGAGDG